MANDEQAIREVITTWMSATKAGDTETVLGLMTDDVVFLVPGQKPFGKEAFAAATAAMKDVVFDGTSTIEEIQVVGDWAFCRTHLTVTTTMPGKPPMRRAGWTLTVLRKDADGAGGRWAIARDANLLSAG